MNLELSLRIETSLKLQLTDEDKNTYLPLDEETGEILN